MCWHFLDWNYTWHPCFIPGLKFLIYLYTHQAFFFCQFVLYIFLIIVIRLDFFKTQYDFTFLIGYLSALAFIVTSDITLKLIYCLAVLLSHGVRSLLTCKESSRAHMVWGTLKLRVQFASSAGRQHHSAGRPNIRRRMTGLDPLNGLCHRIPSAVKQT